MVSLLCCLEASPSDKTSSEGVKASPCLSDVRLSIDYLAPNYWLCGRWSELLGLDELRS